jgi:hypothetical protein
VREQGWLTTDHPQAFWYRIVSHHPDWSQVRVQVAATLDAEVLEIDIVVRPDGYIVPLRREALPGAEAIRIIATAIRAKQRSGSP